jgi:FlaG/FlaF family flagellin (archaellin)
VKAAVAVFLLIFVTVVVGGLVFYQFASDLTEKMKTTFPARSLQIESFDFSDTCLRIHVKNYASVDVQVTDVYVNGETHNPRGTVTISSGDIRAIDLFGSFSQGEAYEVTLFSGVGLPIVFQVEYK